MESFCDLFDPAEGATDKDARADDCVKKKGDTPKGRRRGRKSNIKNETLPEESSFLCDPDLSTEVLVKSGSYIERYFQPVDQIDDDAEKSQRRNSTRKIRRKRNKISPLKDLTTNAWQDNTNWNNQSSITKKIDQSIGKNVNNLSEVTVADSEVKNSDTVNSDSDFGSCVFSDDLFKDSAGEESCEDCSSSDIEECLDEEIYGVLPPEPRFGNVEYKLQLNAPSDKRLQHLVTQLLWRLTAGGGLAVYIIGVRDNGTVRGLSARALRASLRALSRMARSLRADLALVKTRTLQPHRALAEVHIRKLPEASQSVELRVAVVGADQAGKSTLIGVLTQGELDNGRGSARLNMFRHQHEVRSGRTSSLSHEILGFDAQGNVVNYGCSELMTAARIGERSARLLAFLDLAGHTKYQRTTLLGLSGYAPHYGMLVISTTGGVTAMTVAHMGVLCALQRPFFVAASKSELGPAGPLMEALQDALAAFNKKPRLITSEAEAREWMTQDCDNNNEFGPWPVVPVFPVSLVRGFGLRALTAGLLALRAPADTPARPGPGTEPCEFQIDEIFHVASDVLVVGGLVARGTLREGDHVLIGPLESGSFVPTTIKSIYRNRVPRGTAAAGQLASLGLGGPPAAVRPGMVLLKPPLPPGPRAKDDNVQRALRAAQNTLAKPSADADNNTYVSDTEIEKESRLEAQCACAERPRGCLYFQAWVRVLRHGSAIAAGFQGSALVGAVRQTATVQGILTHDGTLREGSAASVVFRLARYPEYLQPGRTLLFTAGLGTRAIGKITQVFPYVP